MDKFTPEQVSDIAAYLDRWQFTRGAEMLRAYAERLRQDEKDARDEARIET